MFVNVKIKRVDLRGSEEKGLKEGEYLGEIRLSWGGGNIIEDEGS